ncbi:MAG: Gfo/Idh/MocA family oxidoreductase [Anaerolineae bacterium]
MAQRARTALVGCGGIAQYHLDQMLLQLDTTHIVALCDPNPHMLSLAQQKFQQAGLEPPSTRSTLEAVLADFGSELDTAFIMTPHAFHHAQAVACLEAGLDVLLEKPMVINAAEAHN